MYKKIDLTKLIIYDIETLCNALVLCFKDYTTQKKKEFIIFNDDEYQTSVHDLYKFIKSTIKHGYTFVGFNNIGFDAQIVTYFYDWCNQKRDSALEFNVDIIIDTLYDKAQSLINIQDSNERYLHLTKEEDLFAPQIDLFKQHHYDRPQKATSLKWVQFSMNYPTIEEMPIDHNTPIKKEDIPTILKYCWNDVDSTYAFFEKAKFESEVRLQLSNEYKLNITNASEPKMVRDIFAKFLCKETGLSYYDLKKLKTIRKEVALKDVIFPYVNFQTKEFKEILEIFKNHVVITDPLYTFEDNYIDSIDKKGNPVIDKKTGKIKRKKLSVKQDNDIALDLLKKEHNLDWLERNRSKFNYIFNFQDIPIALGLGGIHGCTTPGMYEVVDLKSSRPPSPVGDKKYDTDEYEILDLDVN